MESITYFDDKMRLDHIWDDNMCLDRIRSALKIEYDESRIKAEWWDDDKSYFFDDDKVTDLNEFYTSFIEFSDDDDDDESDHAISSITDEIKDIFIIEGIHDSDIMDLDTSFAHLEVNEVFILDEQTEEAPLLRRSSRIAAKHPAAIRQPSGKLVAEPSRRRCKASLYVFFWFFDMKLTSSY
jgi:hypothetical protein